MKASDRLNDVGSVKATLDVTMTVSEWRDLGHQLSKTSWPSFELARTIQDIIDRADKEYTAWSDE